MDRNKIIIEGNLTKDPVLRYTQTEIPVTSFTIACNGKDKDVTFIEIVAWDELASWVVNNFTKGKKVLVKGRLRMDSWEPEKGKKVYRHKVTARSIDLSEDD
jgi:single-strand DNA-binding protein